LNDVILSTNEWIDMIIQGSNTYSITGLQERLDDIYPDKGIVVEFANDSYLLPRDSNFGRELKNPFVAIVCRFKVDDSLYWRDRIPKLGDHIGWSESLSIRLDIWGRTPPETRDISDSVWESLKLISQKFWSQTRTKLEMRGESENYVDKLEGVPDLWHRSINVNLTIFKMKEVD